MNTEAEWMKAMKLSPDDNTLLLAYSDWLEEQGDLLRLSGAREGRWRIARVLPVASELGR